MKGKKILFLFLALLAPVVIFLFLKFFGKNQFEVPVMHQDGPLNAPNDCDFDYTVPYRVADSILARIGVNNTDSVYVISFEQSTDTWTTRIAHEFGDDPVQIINAREIDRRIDVSQLRDCALLMAEDASVALVDHRNRIRGYYDGSNRDEIDRLIVEIKIILRQY